MHKDNTFTLHLLSAGERKTEKGKEGRRKKVVYVHPDTHSYSHSV